MKVVIAIDSLKGSLTSIQAGNAIKTGILRVDADTQVIVKPLADGGEGTTDALIEGLGGERVSLTVSDPFKKPVSTYYGLLPESKTAIIEMASAAGITLIAEDQKDPFTATTYGVGEMIQDALEKGCRNFIIGIGGSATNDGGIGMLKALGYQFLDVDGNDVGEGGQALAKIASVDSSKSSPALTSSHFQVACDVTNPLCGTDGATYIYGPQKGVTATTRDILDAGMENYAAITTQATKTNHLTSPGAGAAGGLGFAFLSYLGANLTPGVSLILDAIHLESELANADLVITGEGRLDHQTIMGKAPIGVARLAKKHNLKVIAFAGSVASDAAACNTAGIDAYFPIVRGVTTLAEALDPETAKNNMADTVEQVFRLLNLCK